MNSSQSIRGKKRQEYIDEWLSGKENPEVEVTPTRYEGKYIVRYRNQNQNNNNQDIGETNDIPTNARKGLSPQDCDSNTMSQESNNNEISKEHESSTEIKQPEIEPIKSEFSGITFSNEFAEQILDQLKIINEERAKKQLKKNNKKEIKRIIHKEFVKNRVLREDSDDYEDLRNEPPPPQPIIIEKSPMKIRRRLNLLDRYKP